MKKMMVLFAAIVVVVFAAKAESIILDIPVITGATCKVNDAPAGDSVTIESGTNVKIEYSAYRDDAVKNDKFFFAGEADGAATLMIELENVTDKDVAEGEIEAAINASPIKPVSDAVCRRGFTNSKDRRYYLTVQDAFDDGDYDSSSMRSVYLLEDIVLDDWLEIKYPTAFGVLAHSITKGDNWQNPEHNALIHIRSGLGQSAGGTVAAAGGVIINGSTDSLGQGLIDAGDLDYAIFTEGPVSIGGGVGADNQNMTVKGAKAAVYVKNVFPPSGVPKTEDMYDFFCVTIGSKNVFEGEEAGIVVSEGHLTVKGDADISGNVGILAEGDYVKVTVGGEAKITGEEAGIKATDCAVKVTSGTIIATAEDGAALEIVNKGNASASIIGGTFEAPNGQAVVSKGEGVEPIDGFIELGSIEKGTSKFLGKTETPKEYIDTPIQGWEKYTDPETGKEYVIPVVGEVGWPASWPTDADQAVKGKFATWKTAYNLEDTYNFEGKEWAFLLNTDPNGEVKKLHIDSITPNYNAADVSKIPQFIVSAGGVDLRKINGVLYMIMGKDLNARKIVVNPIDPETSLPRISGAEFGRLIGVQDQEQDAAWNEGKLPVFHLKGEGGTCDHCSRTSGFFQAGIGFKIPAAE